MQKNRHAFTLIELSIVLVIISLIVGGVIGGKSLIYSARLNSVVSDVNGIKTSFLNFQLQYDAIPGDMIDGNSYWSSYGNGNGNNLIDLYVNSGAETARAWAHMSAAGIYPGTFSGTNGNGPTIGVDAPAAAIEPALYQIFYNTEAGNYDVNQHVVRIGSTDTAFFNRPQAGFLTGANAKALDRKMDDGSASKGIMRTSQGIINGNRQSPGCLGTYYSGEYDPSLSQVSCEVRVTID